MTGLKEIKEESDSVSGPEERAVDRRRSQRQSIKIPVDYSAVDAFFTQFATNINEGGMFVETETPADLGARIQLHFSLPELEEPVRVEATVAWLSDGKAESAAGMGLEFGQLSEETRRTINGVVRRLRRS